MRMAACLVLLGLAACADGADQGAERSHLSQMGVLCPEGNCEIVVGVPVGGSPGRPSSPDPSRPEIPCNGADEDLDGRDLCGPDADGDGVESPIDCDDDDPTRGQLVREILCDGLDQNCDGIDDCDRDGDGAVDRQDCAPDDPKRSHCFDSSIRLEPLE